jgi:hypothetical protein
MERDPLFKDAAIMFINAQKASLSMLKRRMKMGRNRAAFMIKQLQEAGIIGTANGKDSFEVLAKSINEINHGEPPATFTDSEYDLMFHITRQTEVLKKEYEVRDKFFPCKLEDIDTLIDDVYMAFGELIKNGATPEQIAQGLQERITEDEKNID